MATFELKKPRHYVLEYDGKWLTYSGDDLPRTRWWREHTLADPATARIVRRYRRQLNSYLSWIDGVDTQ